MKSDGVLGVEVNGEQVAVAGVAPEGFDGIDLTKAALFAPISLLRLLRPGDNYTDDPHSLFMTIRVAPRTLPVSIATGPQPVPGALAPVPR